MTRAAVGLICCLSFVSLEALQAVYLGALFQGVDSFLVGAWVFGIAVVVSFVATLVSRPAEFAAALYSIQVVVGLNVLAAITWASYFIAIQLIEPAVVFTIFSGMVPLGMVLAANMGLKEVQIPNSTLSRLGNGLILISLLLLAGITVAGMSGFVRGSGSVAVIGIVLSIVSGGCTAVGILFSVRLSARGVGPLAQFGLRFVLYTLFCVLAIFAGVDSKALLISSSELSLVVGMGLLVIAFPLYLMQKAVPLLPASTIAAITALGPTMVFILQLLEGRVSYAFATAVGLLIYNCGAFSALLGEYPLARVVRSAHPANNSSH